MPSCYLRDHKFVDGPYRRTLTDGYAENANTWSINRLRQIGDPLRGAHWFEEGPFREEPGLDVADGIPGHAEMVGRVLGSGDLRQFQGIPLELPRVPAFLLGEGNPDLPGELTAMAPHAGNRRVEPDLLASHGESPKNSREFVPLRITSFEP